MELAIVVAIVGIMATFSSSMFNSGPDRRLKAAARNLWADTRFAQMEAVKRKTDIGIQFWTNTSAPPAPFTANTYLIFVDDGYNGPGGAINPIFVGNGKLDALEGQGTTAQNRPIKVVPMLPSVALLNTNFIGATSIGFNSRGLLNGVLIGNVQLQSIAKPNRAYKLILSHAGHIRLQSSNNFTSAQDWSDN